MSLKQVKYTRLRFLENLLKANADYENENIKTDSLNSGKFHIEISAIPDDKGGGIYVTIPALGRWFAHTDEDTIEGALERLDVFLADAVVDEEHKKAYKEAGINIP
jgi:hypothetical protein